MEQFDITPYLIVCVFGLITGFYLGLAWAGSTITKVKDEVIAAVRQELSQWALE